MLSGCLFYYSKQNVCLLIFFRRMSGLARQLVDVAEEENAGDEGQNEGAKKSGLGSATASGIERGENFKLEWISTERLRFHRTRHLRNPWNHDREVKVSRDGTELEPTVGQQLLDEWETLAADVQSGVASSQG